jgi:hypothetical protein
VSSTMSLPKSAGEPAVSLGRQWRI